MKIAGANPPSDAFARAVWAGWAFLLRVQWECLPLVGQMPRGKMYEDPAPDSSAAIGLEKGHLVIKQHRRKHVAEGSGMVRGCICYKYPAGSPEIHVPQLLCPVCSFWGNARRRVRAAGKLFPGITGPGFTDEGRSAASKFGSEKADRFGTHSIRRGAAGSILGAGGIFAQLLKAAQWRLSAYQSFLD